jgi:glycosyltransferase involved in cell wall biosynthesis
MRAMKYSIVIATYNRATELERTLDSLANLVVDSAWELIVVDNNSTDETSRLVAEKARSYPVALALVHERQQGRSAALNTGIRLARGRIIATTDDDVRVPGGWLETAAAALDSWSCDYVGGRVLPLWGGERPAWLPDRGSRQWAVVALLDYGDRPFEFRERVPLGVNMAFRREAFDRAGGWSTELGRKAGTLLGQEVREWCVRARAAGVRGFYVPGMVVHHVVARDRLNKRYFRRWFYWRGISRAMLYARAGLDMEAPQQTRLDFTKVPHVLGVPRYLYRTCAASVRDLARALARGDEVAAFEHELWLWFFAGILRQRWKDQRTRRTATTGRWSGASVPSQDRVSTVSAESSSSRPRGA